jgi:hypothetical protein
MATSFPSYTNTWVAGFNSGMTEKLIVEYARDWKKAPALMLAGTTSVALPSGYYARIKPDAQARLFDDPAAYEWPDNTPCPIGTNNRSDFDFDTFTAKRYVYSHFIGDLEAEFAAWDIEAQALNNLGNQAVMNRVKQFYSALNTTANLLSDHTDTATNLGGGKWDVATSTARYIQKTLMAVLKKIDQSSVNGLKMDDLFLVVSPTVADAMARSAEIADSLIRAENYEKYMQFDLWKDQLSRYGLPPKLYGLTLVVDPWIKETAANIGVTSSKSYASGTTVAYVIHKPNAISPPSGGKSFGSVEYFIPKGKELVAENIDIPLDKRKLVRVSDMFDTKVTGREGTYLITAVL